MFVGTNPDTANRVGGYLMPEVTVCVCMCMYVCMLVCVVSGFDPNFSWSKLSTASMYLQNDVVFVGTNPDTANRVGGYLMPEVCLCVCVCMYVCMYVCMLECMYTTMLCL